MMTLKHWRIRWVLILVAVGLAACAQPADPQGAGALIVTVSIAPQRYFVERIAGEGVDVNVMVEPGASPATYEPKPEQLAALSQSAAYFSIGVPFENVWLDRIAEANPEMRIVDTAAGIERVPIEAHSHEAGADEDHSDDEDDDHDHAEGAPDPHIWLSPSLVKVQARTIAEALIDLDPDRQAAYEANLDAFLADIEDLEGTIEEALSGVESRKFLVFHPSWGYFAEDFGLEQVAIEVGGQEPSARELAELIALAEEEEIRVVFAQPEFSAEDATTIAEEIGGEVIMVSPLAEDWLNNMSKVADTFAEALSR
jgi:zinc transport system substrate-binding protein